MHTSRHYCIITLCCNFTPDRSGVAKAVWAYKVSACSPLRVPLGKPEPYIV